VCVAEVVLFAGQPQHGLVGYRVDRRTGGGQHDCRDQSFDERRARHDDASGDIGLEELQRHLGTQDGAAEVEQHQDAVRGVHRLDGRGHGRGIRAERRLVKPRCDGDRRQVRRLYHVARQADGGVGQGPAVRDDDDADHDKVAAADSSNIVVLVAPGSW
jgi:hypothetical protein